MTTSLSLYTLSSQVEQLLESDEAFDPETGELSAALVEALALTRDKGVNVCAYILNQESTVRAMSEHVQRINERAAALEKRTEKLRAYLADNMKRSGIHEIAANDGTFKAKLYIDRDSAVEIYDERQLPMEFMTTPKTPDPKPDRTAIKAAIKAGREIAGAKIVKRDRLQLG